MFSTDTLQPWLYSKLLKLFSKISRMYCDLCLTEFSLFNKQKTCKICGAVQCSSCLRFKTKSSELICMDCHYDKKSLNYDGGDKGKLASLRGVTEARKNFSKSCQVLPDCGMKKSEDRKTDNIMKRLEALKENRAEAKKDVCDLEFRLRQLKGLSEEKPSSSSNSRCKEDEVTRLVNQYMEEVEIDKKCGINFVEKEQPSEVFTGEDEDPWCCMCDEDADTACQECEDYFCKRCFNWGLSNFLMNTFL
ncbi:unnamed protein product [Heterobilharzia americana]|nr:unnamed protein product [Heterobilharzia americana]